MLHCHTFVCQIQSDDFLTRTRPGRPAASVTPALEQLIVKGLRLLSWFNVPTLRKWIEYHDRTHPVWTVRRWALALIRRLKIQFPKDWRTGVPNARREWRRSANPLNIPDARRRRLGAMRDSVEPSLNLK